MNRGRGVGLTGAALAGIQVLVWAAPVAELSRARSAWAEESAHERPSDLQRRVATLEAQLAEAREEARSARESLERLQDAVLRQRDVALTEIEKLQGDLARERTASQDLEAAIETERRQNESVEHQIAKLREKAALARELENQLWQQDLRIQEMEESREVDRRQVRDLRVAKLKLDTLVDELRRQSETSSAALRALVERERPAEAPPPPLPVAVDEGRPELQELGRRLDLEQARRQTLEQELARLTAEVAAAEQFREAWRSLQGARGEILVLSNRLADERARREAIELTIEQAKKAVGGEGEPAEWLQKLIDTSRMRKAEAERLQSELHEAKEAIVRLKGRLESVGDPEENARILTELEERNEHLRSRLSRARKSLVRLRHQAELAERLAELVYSQQD